MQREYKFKHSFTTEEYQRKVFGERYVGASLSRLDSPEWVSNKIIEYVKEPKNFLVYIGSPGIGKTYLCAALIDWIISTFPTFRYHAEKDLLKKLRDMIREESGDYATMLEYMCDDEFVILDDVGSGIDPKKEGFKDYEWRKEVFFNFLDYRYNLGKPTMITSNFSCKQFQDIYHERVTSRLFAKENTIIEILNGEDKRAIGY